MDPHLDPRVTALAVGYQFLLDTTVAVQDDGHSGAKLDRPELNAYALVMRRCLISRSWRAAGVPLGYYTGVAVGSPDCPAVPGVGTSLCWARRHRLAAANGSPTCLGRQVRPNCVPSA